MLEKTQVDTATIDDIAFMIQRMEAEADFLREYTAAACLCLSRHMLVDAKNLFIIAVAEMGRDKAPLQCKISLADCHESEKPPNPSLI